MTITAAAAASDLALGGGETTWERTPTMLVPLRENYDDVGGNLLSKDPLLCVVEDFVNQKEIDHLIEAAEPKMQKALVSDDKAGVESLRRSGKNCWIPHTHNKIIEALAQRVSKIVGIPLNQAENFQVIHYAKDQQYAPHYDAWDGTTERGKRCMSKKGQRLVTCLMYLNEPAGGGGTCFPNLDNIEIQPKKGRMIIFHNCREGTILRHIDSLHGGMPVESGEKWACNLWFREKKCR